jgi:hypothetical protein
MCNPASQGYAPLMGRYRVAECFGLAQTTRHMCTDISCDKKPRISSPSSLIQARDVGASPHSVPISDLSITPSVAL